MKFLKLKIVAIGLVLMLGTAGTVSAQEINPEQQEQLEMMQEFISLLQNYLNVADKYTTMLKNQDIAIYMVAESMTELYEKKGDKELAIPKLEKLLEKYKSRPVVRRAILFKIKDIYKDKGKTNEALATLDKIIKLEE